MKTRQAFTKVAILGLGLMGGSLGLAIKRKKLARIVAGYARRARTRRRALAAGAVDAAFDRPDRAVRGADLVVFCLPVAVIPVLARACLPALARNAIVTDVGSSKRELVARLEKLAAAAGARFVGCHPIAGSERQGIAAADARLYENAAVILTPTARTDRRALRRLAAGWRALGARPVVVSPAAHDRILARTSHLPHLAAALLAWTVGRTRPAGLGRFCGHGFRDATRIAEGSPELWRDIIAGNRPAVRRELRILQAGAARLDQLIGRRDWKGLTRFLERSRARRRKLVQGKARA